MAAGNVERLTGQDGTFARGMRPTYQFRGWPDNYVDELETEGATLLLRDQRDVGRAMFLDGGRYRTIVTSVSFSALGEVYRDSLMAAYVRFLTSVPGVGENGQGRARDPGLRAIPSVARPGQTVTLLAGRGAAVLEVLDVAGRVVARLPMEASNGVTWHVGVPAGAYLVRVPGQAEQRPVRVIVLPR